MPWNKRGGGRQRKLSPGSISLERFERLQKLNPILAQGGYTLVDLAARFGVTVTMIAADRDYIMDNWWREDECTSTKDKRLLRIKELEQIKRYALESYIRSRLDKEEVTTRYDKKPCEECNGTGRLPQCKCLNCDGIGYVCEEVISRKVSGNPGEAAFLSVAKNCVIEICKMEALYKRPEVKVQHVISGNAQFKKVSGIFDEVDPNLIIEAKAAIARIEDAAKAKTIEGEVIKTEMSDDKPDGCC